MATTLFQPGQSKRARVTYTNDAGQPAEPDAPPVWDVDATKYTISPDADGKSAVVTSLGVAGVVQVSARAKADDPATPDIEEIILTGDVDTPNRATHGEITFEDIATTEPPPTARGGGRGRH